MCLYHREKKYSANLQPGAGGGGGGKVGKKVLVAVLQSGETPTERGLPICRGLDPCRLATGAIWLSGLGVCQFCTLFLHYTALALSLAKREVR